MSEDADREREAKVERLEARVRELEAVVNAARAEAMLHFEESHRWRQQAQVVDDGLCMAKERIAELEGELGLLLEYFEQGVPYWHGTSPKDRIRAVLKATATGPERDLRDLERLAKQYGLPAQVESLLRVYESDGTMRYQDEFSRRDITRAEAAVLLAGKEKA